MQTICRQWIDKLLFFIRMKIESESAVLPLHNSPKTNDFAQLVVYLNSPNQSISLKIDQFCRQFADNVCRNSACEMGR